MVSHQNPKVLLWIAAFQLVSLQHLLVHGVIPPQAQESAIPFTDRHEVLLCPVLRPAQVPQTGRQLSDLSRNLSSFVPPCKLAEGALSLTVQVTNEEVRKYWPLGYTTRVLLPAGLCAVVTTVRIYKMPQIQVPLLLVHRFLFLFSLPT